MDNPFVYIYAWNVELECFYCIPCLDQNSKVVMDPVTVKLSPNFSRKYNHLLVVTKHPKQLKSALSTLNIPLRLDILEDRVGHLIMKQLTPEEIINGNNTGVPVIIFCANVRLLYNSLKNNYNLFHIEAMGSYQNSLQCYFNYKRIYHKDKDFKSRGLFRIIDGDDVEDRLEYINDAMPPFRILSFDIEAARLDGNFPKGDTTLDRLCTVAFQTKTYGALETNVITRVFAYIPAKNVEFDSQVSYFQTERELLENVIEYILSSKAIYITGWNIMKFDYPFLMNRLLYHDIIPNYISDNKLILMNKGRVPFDVAPPWILSIDTMQCRKRYFPRNLPINPPSNSLNETAKACLDGISKENIDIMKIHRAYLDMEEGGEVDFDYLSQLITYNIKDVELVTRLNEKLQVIETLIPLSQMADLDPGDAIHYHATKVSVTFMRNQYQSSILAPLDPNLYDRKDDDRGSYKGATVFEPMTGIHRANEDTLIGCLDFASLYPSLMLTYNITRGYVSKVEERVYLEKKSLYDRHFTPLWEDGHVYLALKNATSPINILCKDLIRKRKIYKKKDPTVANALKIIVNSLYGVCGLKGTLLYDQTVAALITAFGRHHLMCVKSYFEEKYSGLSVLYGDTDSIFIHYPGYSLDLPAMASEYNRSRLKDTNIVLEAETTFQCLILIRKKLYLAKTENGYKISGFPQRLDKHTYARMTDALKHIIDLTASHREREIEDFYKSLFHKIIDEEQEALHIKVNPLESYKSTCGKNYYVAAMYEKKTGQIIQSPTYVSVYDLIPIVKKIPGKRLTLCLTSEFNEDIHTINKSAPITEFFSKTFDPILQNVFGVDNTLKDMSLRYIERLQSQALLKYKYRGYATFDLSGCVLCRQRLFLDFEHIWPAFHREGFDTHINNNEGKARNVILNIKLRGKKVDALENGLIAYASLEDDPSILKLVSRKKFENLSALGLTVRRILRGQTSSIKVRVVNNTWWELEFLLNLFCFIYNKRLTVSEMNMFENYHQGQKYLIVLPFIAILYDGETKFTYF